MRLRKIIQRFTLLLLIVFAMVVLVVIMERETSKSQPIQESISLDQNLLLNPGFEGGCDIYNSSLYWTPDGGPFHNVFSEICTPDGWTSWWREQFPCREAYTEEEGRPEVKVIDGVADPSRIRSGDQALKMFTFWRCHDFGLAQTVESIPSAYYTFSLYPHSWYSDCSAMPHDPPYNKECDEFLEDSHDLLQVGIDPFGGVDPLASSVVWSDVTEQYGQYGDVISITVQAQSSDLTVFFRSETNYPLKHEDLYVDDASLVASFMTYLPVVLLH